MGKHGVYYAANVLDWTLDSGFEAEWATISSEDQYDYETSRIIFAMTVNTCLRHCDHVIGIRGSVDVELCHKFEYWLNVW
jgi:hypothetical protein